MIIFLIIESLEARECSEINPNEMICWPDNDDKSCHHFNETITAKCTAFHSTTCDGERSFTKEVPCIYCYQTDDIVCEKLTSCFHSIAPQITDCYSTSPCIGPSLFERQGRCSRTSKSQKTAFLLSLFLGVFGADRFYLGYYISASFKLITIGGLGIVYTIDLFLILFGYLGPADGALYPERL